MDRYLVTYRGPDGGFFSELMPMRSVAEFIGFRDVNECTEIKVYRILPQRVEILEYRVHEWRKPCTVSLYDRYGNYIDHGEYANH